MAPAAAVGAAAVGAAAGGGGVGAVDVGWGSDDGLGFRVSVATTALAALGGMVRSA